MDSDNVTTSFTETPARDVPVPTTGEDLGSSGSGTRSTGSLADSLKERVPEVGLFEYWYPVIRARSVPHRKPKTIMVLGEKVVFFRDKSGDVVALGNDCPHRGAQLERAKCMFKGTLTCPYHGWTFDGSGACLAVLGEGPQSAIPGMEQAHARSYPTRTLKGVVFVWMGKDAPAPIEEDVPPELFSDEFHVLSSFTHWDCNWRPAVENYNDAHFFMVHRNSIRLLQRTTTELRQIVNVTPRRPRPEVVNGRGMTNPGPRSSSLMLQTPGSNPSDAPVRARKLYKPSEITLVYPGLENQRWPRMHIRYPLSLLFSVLRRPSTKPVMKVSDSPEIDHEWSTLHLPAIARTPNARFIYTRNVVPIDADRCQVVYFHTRRAKSRLSRAYYTMLFHAIYNWWYNYNFSGQDAKVVETQHYIAPEFLSQTDLFPFEWRRHVLEHARGLANTEH